jgi:uncharacterized protein (TIGR01777 family)
MKRVLITGGSGFIGQKLTHELLARGDQVTVLTRDPKRAKAKLPARVRCAAWDPDKEGAWFDELAVVDAVIHLAGESVAKRWNDKVKAAIERSRYQSTRLLVEAIGKAKHKPSVLVSASATGYYGPQPSDKELDESAEPGHDFLAGVCKLWEEAARGVEAHGVRGVQVRIGVVLGEGGGALEKMILPSRSLPLAVGGPIGDGKQMLPWVHRDDVVGILLLALDNAEITGPINAVSPNPVDSREMARAIGLVLSCPCVPTPAFAISAAMGEAASIVLTGQRVVPRRAIELGYEFPRDVQEAPARRRRSPRPRRRLGQGRPARRHRAARRPAQGDHAHGDRHRPRQRGADPRRIERHHARPRRAAPLRESGPAWRASTSTARRCRSAISTRRPSPPPPRPRASFAASSTRTPPSPPRSRVVKPSSRGSSARSTS